MRFACRSATSPGPKETGRRAGTEVVRWYQRGDAEFYAAASASMRRQAETSAAADESVDLAAWLMPAWAQAVLIVAGLAVRSSPARVLAAR